MSMINLNVRVDADVKKQAEELYASLGLNLSSAINVFLRQSIEADGLPFPVRHLRPNAETLAAMRETEAILSGAQPAKRYSSAAEMFSDLDTEDDTEC